MDRGSAPPIPGRAGGLYGGAGAADLSARRLTFGRSTAQSTGSLPSAAPHVSADLRSPFQSPEPHMAVPGYGPGGGGPSRTPGAVLLGRASRWRYAPNYRDVKVDEGEGMALPSVALLIKAHIPHSRSLYPIPLCRGLYGPLIAHTPGPLPHTPNQVRVCGGAGG